MIRDPRRVRVMAICLVVLALAYILLWLLVAVFSRARLMNVLQRGGAERPVLTLGGFPHWVHLRIKDVSTDLPLLGPASMESLDWWIRPWAPWRLYVQALQLRAEPAQESWTAESALARCEEWGTTPSCVLDIKSPHLPVELGQLRSKMITASWTIPRPAPQDHTQIGGKLSLDIDDLVLALGAGRFSSGLPVPLGRVDMKARIMGAPPYPNSAESLALWSQSGGVIEIDQLRLGQSIMRIDAQGTLTLDAQLRPQGAFTLRMEQPESLLILLPISRETRQALDKALVEGKEESTEGKISFTIPLTVQNGLVQAFGMDIATVPSLALIYTRK
ncbi:MAG: DUF2125 domain-containing protein [Alphaproteobacteria bacterium]|nr:MAG: DUF2125 domain-containing protein [Alphaproteobacteria bacterium]